MRAWFRRLWFGSDAFVWSARRAVLVPKEVSPYEIGSSVVRHVWERPTRRRA